MHTNLSLSKIFTYIGAALIFFGIAFFINLNWSVLNNVTKIIVTLGVAIAAYLVGLLLHFNNKEDLAASGFFFICALVLPAGFYVTANILGYNVNTVEAFLIINAVCLLIFVFSFFYLSRFIFLLFMIIYATLLFFNFIELISDRAIITFADVYEYAFIVTGLSYILLGRYLNTKEIPVLVGPLYFFGSVFLLGSAYCLAGFNFFSLTDTTWKVITGILIFLTLVLSVPLKSKAFLYVGAFFLAIYIIDISSTLADIFGGRGWPLVLVVVGFLFILAGYFIVRIRQKIVSKK
jgi:hypothetical protein